MTRHNQPHHSNTNPPHHPNPLHGEPGHNCGSSTNQKILAITGMGSEDLIRAAIAFSTVYLSTYVKFNPTHQTPPRAEARENFIRITDAILSVYEVLDDIVPIPDDKPLFMVGYDKTKNAVLRKMDFDLMSLEGLMSRDRN